MTAKEFDHKNNGSLTYKRVSDLVLAMLETPTGGWYALFAICLILLGFGAAAWFNQMWQGFGYAGKSHPIGWGSYITNFVFWVGIAHSGTLISAVLYLFRAKFRMPIYRLAEAMTVFAVMTAGLFPVIHLGRPWMSLWLFPVPNERALWPNFRSPLLWDVFAVSTYFTVSATFFFVGLVPDIAVARDRAKSWFRKTLYTITSLGWTGGHTAWKNYGAAYLLFAALATPLVVSVHSVVSWDFAMSIVPGWHATIFPPYFVAGAIFSGVAMVITLIIPLRSVFKLEELITHDHFESMCKLIMLTSGIVSYAYITEFYVAWYSNNPFERYQFWFRPFGEFKSAFWGMFFCNCVAPLTLWWRPLRRHIGYLFVLSIIINIGMWLERFNIIFTSLAREYIPAAWGGYNFSWTEIAITAGAFGWFGMWMMLFIKFFPAVAIAEIKEIMPPPRRNEDENAH
ncbi:MAG TPA: polysulfide reductase NrfD [Oligoflexia bacterium]|nr:polysulfide reductase NrfD [Oligoflexia bacterium]HMP26693.1 polysulfide reductase NrfD [Oligoflexia bacterium]